MIRIVMGNDQLAAPGLLRYVYSLIKTAMSPPSFLLQLFTGELPVMDQQVCISSQFHNIWIDLIAMFNICTDYNCLALPFYPKAVGTSRVIVPVCIYEGILEDLNISPGY